MSKDNPFWCDDCDRIARGLKDIWDDAPPLTTWCPNCGRLEDSEGTMTPRKGAQDARRIEELEAENRRLFGALQDLEAAYGQIVPEQWPGLIEDVVLQLIYEIEEATDA